MSESRAHDALFDAAVAAWPREWINRRVFADYVCERLDAEHFPSDEAAADLYLACACLRGVGPALHAFDARYLPSVQRVGARAGLTADEATELSQILREELLVGRSGAAPALGAFHGRGDLRSWLRVTSTRAAIRMKKRRKTTDDGELNRLEARATGDDPELSYLKAFYRDAFRGAFRSAATALEPRDRRVLHQHSVDGLSIDEIGGAHGVHRATAARWVQAAREKLVADVRREFAQRVKVSPRELASVLRLVESRLEVTMKRLLA